MKKLKEVPLTNQCSMFWYTDNYKYEVFWTWRSNHRRQVMATNPRADMNERDFLRLFLTVNLRDHQQLDMWSTWAAGSTESKFPPRLILPLSSSPGLSDGTGLQQVLPAQPPVSEVCLDVRTFPVVCTFLIYFNHNTWYDEPGEAAEHAVNMKQIQKNHLQTIFL